LADVLATPLALITPLPGGSPDHRCAAGSGSQTDRRPQPTPSDPVERRIRELQQYSSDDDPDSSVQIQALPGSTVQVMASKPDSDPPIVRKSKTVRVIAAIVGALVSIGAIAKAMWDAAH